MLRVSNHYKTTLRLDGEDVKFVIAKLSKEQATAFGLEFDRVRKIEEGEQLALAASADEVALTSEQLQAKRYVQLDPEEQQRRDARERERAEHGDQFAVEAITAYVTAEPGQIFDEDEHREITSGADLVRHFGNRPDVLALLMSEIWLQNRLSEEQKKKLRLLRAFARSSDGPAAAGETPAPTAASVGSEGSALIAAATDGPGPIPSGSTETSS